MNSDTGFSCHQLDKDDVYQIDNSKSSCALFMIQGQVNLDLGEFYEGEMEQGQMLYIPQSIKAQIESITGSRCILLFWDKHISTCDKLFLSSLSIKENDTDTNDVILPIKKPLMNVLESVNLYLNARLLCRHMHLLKQQELLLVLRGFYTKKELEAMIVVALGGRAAEEIVFDTVTTGASNDIEQATKIARAMITQYGMSDRFGLMGLESIQNKYLDGRAVLNCGEATAGEIDEEVMKMLKSAYAEAKKLLSENREALDKIAEFLIEKETITGKEFMKIFREVKGISEPEEGAVSGIEERGRIAMK